MDGGIRRGSDVFKALGLGADGVLVGRPGAVGSRHERAGGATQVLNLLNKEPALTMTLAGYAQLGDMTPDLLYGDPMFRVVPLAGDRMTWTAGPSYSAPAGEL